MPSQKCIFEKFQENRLGRNKSKFDYKILPSQKNGCPLNPSIINNIKNDKTVKQTEDI